MSHDKETIYFMGIGGTGMASVAGLLKKSGYHVVGSDAGVYPPMSDVLSRNGIAYATPYSPANLDKYHPTEVVVANVLSRGHEELEAAIARDYKLTSFPKILKDRILSTRSPVVVCGTHGKTTTTTILTHVLKCLDEDVGYFIGGQPRGLESGFEVGTSPLFLLEGDEYDTAYFDKKSKFFHYMPRYTIFNNVEFDHADIFESLEQIEECFGAFLKLVEDPANIVANVDDEGVRNVLKQTGLQDKVTTVAGYGKMSHASLSVQGLRFDASQKLWVAQINGTHWGDLEVFTPLSGAHNICNVAQTLALLGKLVQDGVLTDPGQERVVEAYRTFGGVARRLDLLGERHGVIAYEDFAHHPTAVGLVIDSLRQMYPEKRLLVAFEPKNATSRRNVFLDQFAESLSKADQVFIGPCPDDKRISDDEKMDTSSLAQKVRSSARAYLSNEDLLSGIAETAAAEDVVVFMSPGSFSGIQHRFLDALK